MLSKGENVKIFKQKEIVGGGIRKNVVCPYCNSYDRERFIDYLLEKYSNIYDKNENKKILHIAPEKNIRNKIKKNNHEYITGDIKQKMSIK